MNEIKIRKFEGQHFFLSNFYPSPIIIDGLEYPTVEHAFQAFKSKDINERIYISKMPTPGTAKRAGRNVTLRKDWENIKVRVMTMCVRQKFYSHPNLAKKLLDTGDAYLEEGNTWNDQFWGVCRGRGANNLGKILMRIREEMKVD